MKRWIRKVKLHAGVAQYSAQDIRFTTNGEVLYATSLAWSAEDITIHSIDESLKVKQVSMLGSNEDLVWSQTPEGLKVKFPNEKPSEYAHSLKITFM